MLHIVKLCVGVTSVDELEEWRDLHATQNRMYGKNHFHRTRMMPRRADEIVGQGSLYWVIGGAIRCRQPIVALEAETNHEGRSCCDIVMAPEIIRTIPQPKRPFQGWRYLKAGDAPHDMPQMDGTSEGDASLAEELASMGLI